MLIWEKTSNSIFYFGVGKGGQNPELGITFSNFKFQILWTRKDKICGSSVIAFWWAQEAADKVEAILSLCPRFVSKFRQIPKFVFELCSVKETISRESKTFFFFFFIASPALVSFSELWTLE